MNRGVSKAPLISCLFSINELQAEGEERELISFSFRILFYLYRGEIAVLKYVRSYLHSPGLVTETNKIKCC